eukprot:5524956-Amphidinium_carterae.1
MAKPWQKLMVQLYSMQVYDPYHARQGCLPTEPACSIYLVAVGSFVGTKLSAKLVRTHLHGTLGTSGCRTLLP